LNEGPDDDRTANDVSMRPQVEDRDRDIGSSTTEEETQEPDGSPDTRPDNRPLPIPRRSTRDRRPPQRFSDYYLHQMVTVDPVDERVQSIFHLIKSGIFKEVDSETARKMISAVIMYFLLYLYDYYFNHFVKKNQKNITLRLCYVLLWMKKYMNITFCVHEY